MTNVYCIGELLIDFISTESGVNIQSAKTFAKKAGGAPANVAVAIAKTGGSAYFLGQVGKDSFGNFLKQTIVSEGVNADYLQEAGQTTLAFVSLAEDGERSFEFVRGSDGQYQMPADMLSVIQKGDIIHFGSATGFLPGKLKESYFQLLEAAKNTACFISFDPNYRDLLITDIEQFRSDCFAFIKHANLIKLSEEEALLLSQKETLNDALAMIASQTRGLITITRGKDGTLLYYQEKQMTIPSIKIEALDTTGAGDCFIGTLLGSISKLKDAHLFFESDVCKELVRDANVAAALTCTKYGAIEAIPTRAEIEKAKGEQIHVG